MKNKASNSLSELLFDELCKSANSNRRENAQNIKTICDQMDSDRIEITLNGVAKRCLESFGSPAISTVTNTGSKLGKYVRLRKEEQSIEKGSVIEKVGVSAKIQDPILAQEVKILEAMVKSLRNQNNALRVVYKKLDVDIDNGIRQILTPEKTPSDCGNKQLSSPKYSTNLKNAVAALFDHLSGRGYSIYKGRFGINKKTVLTIAELDALKDVCSMSESEFQARYFNNK